MTTRLMPDFTDALEERLRRESTDAAIVAPRSWRARPQRRLVLPAFACLAATAALLALFAVDDDRTAPAYGTPLVLRTPLLADGGEVLAKLNAGQTVASTFGDEGRLTEVRAVKAFGATAYFATGPQGTCLVAPDPLVDKRADPLRTGAVTCGRTEDLLAYGIVLAVGGKLIAAIPENATNPTLTEPNGSTRELRPSAQGVVAAQQVPPGSTFRLYAADGSNRPFRTCC